MSNTDFATVTLNHVNQSKQNQIIEDLKAIKTMYMNGLNASNISIKGDDNIVLNLTRLVHYTIVFIETNGFTIAKTLCTDLNSDFKLANAVNLIMDITTSLFPRNQIVAYINHMVSIIFPHLDSSAMTVNTLEDTPVKSASLKKGWKYMLTKSGCTNVNSN